MKGFIEVTYNDYNGGKELLVQISAIERIEPYRKTMSTDGEMFKGTKTMIMTTCSNCVCVKETYEEIKKKIEQAGENK